MRKKGEMNTEETKENIWNDLVICNKLYRIEYWREIVLLL